MIINRKDLAASLFFGAVGLLYGVTAWRTLPIGTAFNMGPGYFPVMLSGALIGLGLAIMARSFFTQQREPFGIIPWRAVGMLSLTTIVFAAFFEQLGMLPGVFVTTFLATLSSPQIPALKASLIAGCTAVFCTAVFSFGIHLPVPVIGPIFGI